MTVRELMAELILHMDKEILFSQDEEGNAMMDNCNISIENNKVILLPFNYVDTY